MFLSHYTIIAGLLLILLANESPRTSFAGRPGVKTKWIVQKTSTLSIDGRTNVNRFSCAVGEYTEPDTISCFKSISSTNPQGVPLQGVLRINIEAFNCHNRIMTTEFKKTLKYKQYPQLKVCFISLEKMPFSSTGSETIKGAVDIELAGLSRRFEITYTSSKTDAGEFQLIGNHTFCFSDFQLQPPQKMGGLIRVNDQLNVQFILFLKQME
jgi:hypothetical protein